jgi:hypothetical protein
LSHQVDCCILALIVASIFCQNLPVAAAKKICLLESLAVVSVAVWISESKSS